MLNLLWWTRSRFLFLFFPPNTSFPWPWLSHRVPGTEMVPSTHAATRDFAEAAESLVKQPIPPKAQGVDKKNLFLGLTYPFLWTVSPNSLHLFPLFHRFQIKILTFVYLLWLVSAVIKHHCASTQGELSKVFEANQSVSFSPTAVSWSNDRIDLLKRGNTLKPWNMFWVYV